MIPKGDFTHKGGVKFGQSSKIKAAFSREDIRSKDALNNMYVMTQQYVSLGTYSTEMGMYVLQKTVKDAKKMWGKEGLVWGCGCWHVGTTGSKICMRAETSRQSAEHKVLCKPCETDETSCQRGRAVSKGKEHGNGRVKSVVKELDGTWNWRERGK